MCFACKIFHFKVTIAVRTSVMNSTVLVLVNVLSKSYL